MLNALKNKLVNALKFLKKRIPQNDSELTKRIRKRNKTFWEASDAKTVKNTIMSASDPIKDWANIKHWQRKLSNKYNSREFAKMHNCQVPDLYWKGRDYKNIIWDNLPQNYVIRPTIGYSSNLVFLMSNSISLMNGKTYSKEGIEEILKSALEENSRLEFLIEEFLKTEEGLCKIPDDYKFYTFNGKIATIQVINRLGPSKGFTSCYDENWRVMKNVNDYYTPGAYHPAPRCLSEMVQYAKELSKSYKIFVRIDFYATNKGAVFGEFTPTPFMGRYFTPYGTKLLIDHWNKFCKGKI